MDDVTTEEEEWPSETVIACWMLLVIELDAIFWIFVVRFVESVLGSL